MDTRTQPQLAAAHADLRAVVAPSLIRVTETAALACARHIGRGNGDRLRAAASAAMLEALERLGIAGRVVLGPRGDQFLSHGTAVGESGVGGFDLAVYPVEGSSLVAKGMAGAISLLVAVEPDSFPKLPAVWYAERIVAGPAARGTLALDEPLVDNLRRIAFARDARVNDLAVAVLDRPRHNQLISELRDVGARIVLLEEGEISGALLAASEGTGIDAMVGIGGLQETMIAACAARCLGGELQARLWPRNEEERVLAGPEAGQILGLNDLSPEHVDVAVTGISGGPLLRGAWYGRQGAQTESLTMSTRFHTVRRISTQHQEI
ncbi:MAG: fructose-bisphosphatase class II [Candidatus Dormibacteraeota bacterium]|uniref:Fructose-1,6-bisphosphatase n=1 Tax=Candidatus Dormiibacter inghamiae TaxID=3127013 RepID=A0A934KI32_9BACT|nr:fructose-bisphosphatase class II [Candidatus Dormibacteraeota bacterium]MBJ7605856.1 fructose-bisphosphatase class II [Candidatus Dormibacteraeota bacterium]